jgi:hypothetical protein
MMKTKSRMDEASEHDEIFRNVRHVYTHMYTAHYLLTPSINNAGCNQLHCAECLLLESIIRSCKCILAASSF